MTYVDFKLSVLGVDLLNFHGLLGPFPGGFRTSGTTSIQFLVQFYTFLENLARISLAGAHSPHWSLGLSPPSGLVFMM